MNYNPRQEKDIRGAMCLRPGIYDFEIAKATEKVSKAGHDMIEMDIRVFASDGSTRMLRDWLVPGSDMGDMKLNRFSHATGLQEAYFNGALDEHACTGASGRLNLTIQHSEEYGDQMRVKDYEVPGTKEAAPDAPVTPQQPAGVPSGQTKAALEAAHAREKVGLGDAEIPF